MRAQMQAWMNSPMIALCLSRLRVVSVQLKMPVPVRAGADKVSVNSAVYDNPDLINRAALLYGAQCVLSSIDVRWKKTGNISITVMLARNRQGMI